MHLQPSILPPQKKIKSTSIFYHQSHAMVWVGALRKISAAAVSISQNTKNVFYSPVAAEASPPLTPQLRLGTQSWGGTNSGYPPHEGSSGRVVRRLSGNRKPPSQAVVLICYSALRKSAPFSHQPPHPGG